MIRNVNLVSYLPPFMQNYKELVAALESENAEFTIVWDAVNRILYNRFISTADEYGISRYEKMLGIYPNASDTLESRRAKVQSRWFQQIPYTFRVLLDKLTVLSGDNSFTLTHNFEEGYTITLITNLELFGQVEVLNEIFNSVLPCNIVVDSKNVILCEPCGPSYIGTGVVSVDVYEIS